MANMLRLETKAAFGGSDSSSATTAIERWQVVQYELQPQIYVKRYVMSRQAEGLHGALRTSCVHCRAEKVARFPGCTHEELLVLPLARCILKSNVQYDDVLVITINPYNFLNESCYICLPSIV